MSFNFLPRGIVGNYTRRFSWWDTGVNANWLSIDTHYKGLAITDAVATQGDLPSTPTDGQSFVVESNYHVWTWFEDLNQWINEPLEPFEIFYDINLSAFYYFDGANIVALIVNDDIIPSGTRMLFYEATAPLGWTLDVTVNDRFVRVSNTAGGNTGGTWDDLTHNHPMPHTHSNTHNHSAGTSPSGLRARLFPQGDGTNGIRYHFSAYTGSWTGNYQTNGGTNSSAGSFGGSGGVVITGNTANYTGNTGGTNTANTSSANITHGSSQHQFANFIICSRN